MKKINNNNLSYCGRLVFESDPDRFLLSMFAPHSCRESLFALFAFNHEIAKTREVVTESTMGLIRLQWWREAIAAIYDNIDRSSAKTGNNSDSNNVNYKYNYKYNNEIIKALARAIVKYNLPHSYFDKLIYAREFDLENRCPGNLEGLLKYADFTGSDLLRLANRITSKSNDKEDKQIEPIAINYALAGILRSIQHHARQGRCLLPADMLASRSIDLEKLYNFEKQSGISGLLEEIAKAQKPVAKSDDNFLRATDILTKIYFKHLKAAKYDPYSPKYHIDPPFKVLRLTWSAKFMCF